MYIKKQKTGDALRQYGFWLLSRRDYGEQEFIKKLNQYSPTQEESLALAKEFKERGYINDEKVAKLLLTALMERGLGKSQIVQKFKEKGLSIDYIQGRFDEVDWLKQAYELKVRRFGAEVVTDPKIKNRQIGFLSRRGYSFDVIMKAISLKQDELEWE